MTTCRLCVLLHSSGVNASVEYVLEVSGVSPLSGSLLGGTRLTVSGSGFSSNPADNKVVVGEQQSVQPAASVCGAAHSLCPGLLSTGSSDCEVAAASDSELLCVVQSEERSLIVTNQGFHLSTFLLVFVPLSN